VNLGFWNDLTEWNSRSDQSAAFSPSGEEAIRSLSQIQSDSQDIPERWKMLEYHLHRDDSVSGVARSVGEKIFPDKRVHKEKVSQLQDEFRTFINQFGKPLDCSDSIHRNIRADRSGVPSRLFVSSESGFLFR
jgi:hypothetical protein